ncbi:MULTISPECIES: antibiotic biosynthesis monooxygenase [unclassified Brenneria]|uniref:antibiotic biosynthesis monooxygenase family protein n=1 Tax=unclassified Brenneria TaxID=2634434 RepID=UPI0029C5C0B5|nr:MULTISPECIES: antibiotic biosynthesis monooxygenase [unclassified Brenneria]MDX5627217.1 antibiotic biosynthesis monooxygenase [Brenneria sp. L3-3Z]MDX5694627.1 antibiotic biosynthesis monooxygenase [Brenneria sp. L4-2C]MEE3661760.1 antibiotic biosynthesis monooxygenase [Brenneria sp. g21c3]
MSHAGFARLPEPPYFAVVFSSQRTPGDRGYDEMSSRMAELAMTQPGYLGAESARDQQGFGITVSYWDSLDAIKQWKRHSEHRIAQEFGIAEWYQHYELRIAEVKYAYGKRQG